MISILKVTNFVNELPLILFLMMVWCFDKTAKLFIGFIEKLSFLPIIHFILCEWSIDFRLSAISFIIYLIIPAKIKSCFLLKFSLLLEIKLFQFVINVWAAFGVNFSIAKLLETKRDLQKFIEGIFIWILWLFRFFYNFSSFLLCNNV